jgi:hypothetical protein
MIIIAAIAPIRANVSIILKVFGRGFSRLSL